MSRVPSWKKDRMIELWLEGQPRDFIAKKLKASGEIVSRYVTQFKSSLTKRALDELK